MNLNLGLDAAALERRRKFVTASDASGLRALDAVAEAAVLRLSCIEWTAAIGKDGYGRKWHPGKKQMTTAHRFVWEAVHGPLPGSVDVDHRCRNRKCVNL